MGYADRVPNISVMSKHQWIPRVVPILGSTDCHLAVAVLARFRCARFRWWGGSGLLRTPVSLAADHHGPDDAGHFVGQRKRGELLWLARKQFQQPWRGGAPLGLPDDRGGAEHEQPPQILVARPADPAGPVFAGRGVPRGVMPTPGGKVPARAKDFCVRLPPLAPAKPVPISRLGAIMSIIKWVFMIDIQAKAGCRIPLSTPCQPARIPLPAGSDKSYPSR